MADDREDGGRLGTKVYNNSSMRPICCVREIFIMISKVGMGTARADRLQGCSAEIGRLGGP